MADEKNPAMQQEQTGQVYPDKDVAPSNWKKDAAEKPTTAYEREHAKPKAQVRSGGEHQAGG
jgi:hypothetical protein